MDEKEFDFLYRMPTPEETASGLAKLGFTMEQIENNDELRKDLLAVLKKSIEDELGFSITEQ